MLVAQGYEVWGATRSQSKAEILREAGVRSVVLDVFDALKLENEMLKISPEVVLHQLTDLPDGLNYGDKMDEVLARNAKIREIGTRNLVAAAQKAGAKKIIAQSLAFIYEPTTPPYDESSALLNFADATYGETSRAVSSLESQVLGSGMTGIVLRNGLIYGDGTGFDAPFEGFASVHVDAAAYAVMLALKCETNEIFNIVNTDGITSNLKAKNKLGWDENFRL